MSRSESPAPERENLAFVGAGKEGRVYRLDAERCIKYYNRDKYRRRELAALQRGQGDPLLPRLFASGKDFVIREYIEGIPLSDYLAAHGMTRGLAARILSLHGTLIRLGYRRADLRLDHIILTPRGELRVIDPTNLMKVERTFPRKLLDGLERLGHRQDFLALARELRPDVFAAWAKHLAD